MKVFATFIVGCLTAISTCAAAEEQGIPIPRSSFDKGKYYLVESTRSGNTFINVVKRVGVDSVVFTKTEVDCTTRQFRFLGESYESKAKIRDTQGTWTELVPGSSKSDLVNFICK